jgi:hypothetical protein
MEVLLTTISSMFKPDERFILHRYYSSRLALVVGMLALAIWFNYELIANHRLHWDLAAIAGVMAVTKLAAMIYYKSTH